MSNINWLAIKNDYINSNTSYRKLANKYGVNKDTIAKRAQAENWIKAKDIQTDKIQTATIQKTADKIIAKEVNRFSRFDSLIDELLTKAEQAVTELDCHAVINKKTAKKNYISEDSSKIEVTTENKTLTFEQGIIKINEIKQLASALKDLKDIQQATTPTPTTETSTIFTALEDEE